MEFVRKDLHKSRSQFVYHNQCSSETRQKSVNSDLHNKEFNQIHLPDCDSNFSFLATNKEVEV